MTPLLLTLMLTASQPIPVPVPVADTGPIVVEAPKSEPAKWKEIVGTRGRAVRLLSDVPAKWKLAEESPHIDLVPDSDGKNATLFAAVDGRYKVVTSSDKGALSGVVVVIGDTPPVPVPPQPAPQPQPTPPAPVPPQPSPAPTPPKPVLSDKAKALLAACEKDGGLTADNRADLAKLADLASESVAFAKSAEVRTSQDFATKFAAAAKSHVNSKLPYARGWLTDEVKGLVGGENAFLTDDGRKAWAKG